MKNKGTLNILLIAIGMIGLVVTGFIIIRGYNQTKDIKGFLKIALIDFIPFVVSYALTRMGIKRMLSDKR